MSEVMQFWVDRILDILPEFYGQEMFLKNEISSYCVVYILEHDKKIVFNLYQFISENKFTHVHMLFVNGQYEIYFKCPED